MIGAWNLELKPAALPEKAATAFTQTIQHLVGAEYVPVLYVGEQIVHGVNYMVICKKTILAQNAPPPTLAKVVINSCDDEYRILEITDIVKLS